MKIRARTVTKIPASFQATGGLDVSKQNGRWTLKPKWDDLGLEETVADPQNRQIWAYNPTSGVYTRVKVDGLATGAVAGVAVRYDAEQSLTNVEKQRALRNAGLAAVIADGATSIAGHADSIGGALALQSTLAGSPALDRIYIITNAENQWIFEGNGTVNAKGQFRSAAGDWLEDVIPSTMDVAQFASVSPYGGYGVLGASRTSDAPHLGFTVGVGAFGINDRTDGTGYYGNLVTSFYSEARHGAGVPSNARTLCQENDIITAPGSEIGAVDPYVADVRTINLNLSNGRPDVESGDASMAIWLHNNTGTTTSGRYLKGIVFGATSILGSDGLTGVGDAIAFAKGHRLSWFVEGQPNSPQAYIVSTIANAAPTTPNQGIDFQDTGIFIGSSGNGMAISIDGYLSIGGNGTAAGGRVGLLGKDSGIATIKASDIAGSPVLVLPATSGIVATSSNPLSFFSATTSAELRSVMTDETGTGALVFGTDPTLTGNITVSGNETVTGVLTVLGAVYLGAQIKTGVTTVAGLPAASPGEQGSRMMVTDATSTTFNSIVAGGGPNAVPVVCNGTNWVIG